MGNVWYFRVGDEASGPRTREDLEHMRAIGDLEPTTLVWSEGTAAWIAYGDSGLASPEPPPFSSAELAAFPQSAGLMALEPAVATSGLNVPAISPAQREPMDGRTHVPRRPVFDQGLAPAIPGMPRLAVGDDGWQVTDPAPWRRYFGRIFDVAVLGMLIWVAISFVVGHANPALHNKIFGSTSLINNALVSTMLMCISVTPMLALLIGLTGSSPGKWIFGTRITRPDGRPIGIGKAFKRELEVLVSGLAFGIPIIALFTLLAAKSRLSNDDVTRWDERRPWVVTHRPQGALQIILCVVGIAIWIAINLWVRSMAHN